VPLASTHHCSYDAIPGGGIASSIMPADNQIPQGDVSDAITSKHGQGVRGRRWCEVNPAPPLALRLGIKLVLLPLPLMHDYKFVDTAGAQKAGRAAAQRWSAGGGAPINRFRDVSSDLDSPCRH
jgi:hypothetical protein